MTPPGDPARGPRTSLLNEDALEAMVAAVGERVAAAVAAGRFPVVHGGDCTTLLGTVPALGGAGLLFLDGHEDTMPLDSSEDGEAANTEIGLLLGLTGRLLTGPLAAARGALTPDRLAVLGPRDEEWRRRFNVGSLRDAGVHLADAREVAADPAGAAVGAVARLGARWWLHVDLDVLDPVEFVAQGVPGDPGTPGGLTWAQLTTLMTTAVAQGGCVGLSVAIYDPEQDPTRAEAARIVELVDEVIRRRPAAGRPG